MKREGDPEPRSDRQDSTRFLVIAVLVVFVVVFVIPALLWAVAILFGQ
jgi:hypothetical protein